MAERARSTVEASGSRGTHDLDGASEPYNRGVRHAAGSPKPMIRHRWRQAIWKSGRCRWTERRAERTNGRLRRARREPARTAVAPARRGACRGQRNDMSEATATRASAGLRFLAHKASLRYPSGGCASGTAIPHRAFEYPLHFAGYLHSGTVYETKIPSPQMSLLQRILPPRSPESQSPAVLFGHGVSEGQQGFEPTPLAQETGESRLLAWNATRGSRARLARRAIAIPQAGSPRNLFCYKMTSPRNILSMRDLRWIRQRLLQDDMAVSGHVR